MYMDWTIVGVGVMLLILCFAELFAGSHNQK